jgi:hypothetical protein
VTCTEDPMTHLLRLALLTVPLTFLACSGGGILATDTGSGTGTNATNPDLSIGDVDGQVDELIVTLIHVTYTLGADATTWVAFHTGNDDWQTSPPVKAGAGEIATLIVGVPSETEITWKVVAESGATTLESDEQMTKTGVLPDEVPEFLLAVNDPTGWESPYILGTVGTSSINTWVLFVLNREGQIVWYYFLEEGFWAPYVKLSYDGRSILFNGRNSPDDDRRLFRIGIDGVMHQEWRLDGMSHAFAELADGVIVYPSEDSRGDEEVTYVYPDGSTEVIWSCTQWFWETGNRSKQCFHNGLNWYPDRGTFLISFYNLNTVVEVNIEDGKTLRSFGDIGTSYEFTDRNVSFDFQHHPTWTSRGGLMVTTSDPPGETWAREFEVDEASETITQIWTYGEGEGLEAKTIGEATRLPNDNTLLNWGATPQIREVKMDGSIVWDGYLSKTSFMGRIQPIEDLYDFYCPGCYEE